jgi:hypothetical protein
LKFESIKATSKIAFESKDFLLYCWMMITDKLFGFTVSVDNYYKYKIKNLQRNKGSGLAAAQKEHSNKSIVQMPKVSYHSEQEHISFTQMMWLFNRGEKLAVTFLENKKGDSGQLLQHLSKEYENFNVLKSSRQDWLENYRFMLSFYTSLFEQRKITEFWCKDVVKVMLEPFIFQHMKLNELHHDSDGVVNESKVRFILKFNYEKFMKYFGSNNQTVIQSLIPVLLWTEKKKALKITNLNSFVNILKILTLKKDLSKTVVSYKRINDIDKIMFTINKIIDKKKQEAEIRNLKDDVKTSGVAQVKSAKPLDELFSSNYKEVTSLLSNDFKVTFDGSTLNTNNDLNRIQNSEMVVTNKKIMNFSFDKLLKKRKKNQTKGSETEGKQVDRFQMKKLVNFQKASIDLVWDYQAGFKEVITQILDNLTHQPSLKHESYDLLINIKPPR